MKWTDDLSVGMDLIDDQHKELFDRISGLVDSIKEHACKDRIGDVVKFLDDYVVFHFTQEKEIMEKFNYPGYEGHMAQHNYFIEQFSYLKRKLLKIEKVHTGGSYYLSVETNQVVVDWILEHIVKVDRQLGLFLKDKL